MLRPPQRLLRVLSISLAAIGIIVLTLYAYRGLLTRPFAADDYQWLLNVSGLQLTKMLRTAFDPSAQSHFYRPLVWLLFWFQRQEFGLNPGGYHVVSLALHLLNAGLLGTLTWRLGMGYWGGLLAAGFVALHPAPFEAIVWISAQSELLAAALLLVMLHLWLQPKKKEGQQQIEASSRAAPLLRSFLATLTLGLALLAKESAVIGLGLLVLLECRGNLRASGVPLASRIARFALPALITCAYISLQIGVERRNYLLAQGAYGIGPQLLLNPLRSFALLIAPLSGTDHADTSWLVVLGAVIAVGLLVLLIRGPSPARRIVLALLLTLLPTAPFTSPPDSRYLYLPVMVFGVLIVAGTRRTKRIEVSTSVRSERSATRNWSLISWSPVPGPWSLEQSLVPGPWSLKRHSVLKGGLVFGCLLLAWAATGEVHARENRFAAASGPGGSLWHITSNLCTANRPDRVVVVEPPLAASHAAAIIRLACGPDVGTKIVSRDQLAQSIKPHSAVVSFTNGSAVVEQQT